MTTEDRLENELLDVLGCQPSLFKLYTQVAFVYATSDEHVVERQVATSLRRGLDNLAAQLPWLCGKVINENSGRGKTGTYRIVKIPEIPMVVRDLRQTGDVASLDQLRDARYPFSMLDEKLVAPCMTLNFPGQKAGLVADTGPVLALQVNIISGGVILTAAAQHNVMDMVGMANVMRWLDTACQGKSLAEEELAAAKMDKSRVLTLHDEYWSPDEEWLNRLLPKTQPESETAPDTATTPPKVWWGYVDFSIESVSTLKGIATQTKDADIDYISSDDAVCAFIWKCLSRARTARTDGKRPTVFARAVDLRRRMGVPPAYPGTLTNLVYTDSSLDSISAETLGRIAAKLRGQLNSSKLSNDTRALATVIDRLPDKGIINITAPVDPSTGIMLSSWASVQLDQLDFGVGLGLPLAVRRPVFDPVESLMYILPKSSSGGAVVGLCLREEDWAVLERDDEWRGYASYIG